MKRRARGDNQENKTSSIADAIKSFLGSSRIGEQVDQAEVVALWPEIVGAQIAAVTIARAVVRDTMLIVDVDSNAWMNELSLREPEILAAIRHRLPGSKLSKIRWQLRRD